MTSKEKAIEALDTKTYQFLAKHLELDVDFSPKCLSCIKDFINDDDEEDFEIMAQKDIDLFDGEEVRYGDYLIKIVPIITQPTLDDAIKVVEEMHNKESDLITTSYGQVERSYHRSRCGALYEVLTALKGLKGE